MARMKQNKIAALNRILKMLDGEAVKLPEEVQWLGFKEGYQIPPDDLHVLEEYRDIEINKNYQFRDGTKITVKSSFQYETMTSGSGKNITIYIRFFDLYEVKEFLNEIINWLEVGWIT